MKDKAEAFARLLGSEHLCPSNGWLENFSQINYIVFCKMSDSVDNNCAKTGKMEKMLTDIYNLIIF